MSTEDQDKELGRLTRLRSESKREIAALEARLNHGASAMKIASVAIREFVTLGLVTGMDAALQSIPAASSLQADTDELRSQRDRVKDIESQLGKFTA